MIWFSLCFVLTCFVWFGQSENGNGRTVEYVRLPLYTLDSPLRANVGDGGVLLGSTTIRTTERRGTRAPIVFIKEGDEPMKVAGKTASVDELLESLTTTEDSAGAEGSLEGGGDEDEGKDEEEEGDGEDEEEFTEDDLVDLVQALERQADVEERTGMLPEILNILRGNGKDGLIGSSSTTTTLKSVDDQVRNGSLRISMNSEGNLQLGSEDLSEFSEEIIDGISEGVEESLRMSDDLVIEDDLTRNFTQGDNATAETRQFSVYLFQGQYYAEPRLNRFIDGALRNMGTELRVASMDPLYFRVLPRGQVAERDQPLFISTGLRRRRPAAAQASGRSLVKRAAIATTPAFYRPFKSSNNDLDVFQIRRENQILKQLLLRQQLQSQTQGQGRQGNKNQVTRITNIRGGVNWLRRKSQQLMKQRRRRLRQQRLRQQQLKNQKKKQQQNKNKQQQQLLNRIRRRIRQDVGGGRIDGLSRVQRDGDAEMQLFGNYTLIRSHMKMGPIEITMQFRTKNGIRRSGATIACVRAHTVTRVNHEGSEMIDYLLDRPQPETIRVRGTLFPLAQRIARNIFARLFLPNSFLVAKLREKAGLAFLSKPLVP